MSEEDQILLDVHKREVVYESLYVKHLHTTVDFMIAVEGDEPKTMEYLDKHAKVDAQNDYTRQSLANKLLILVTDCFEICGLINGQLFDTTQLDKAFEDPELKVAVKEHLPKECKNVVFVNVLNVRKDYREAGIEQRLWTELLKLAKLTKTQWVVLVADDVIENLNSNANGFVTIKSSSFNDNDSNAAQLLIANLEQLDEYLKEPTPTLPDAYKLPRMERQLLTKQYTERLKSEIYYAIATKADEAVIKDFLRNEYFRQTLVTRTLQCRRQDGVSLLKRFRPEVIEQGLAVLAIVDGKLCGLFINAINVLTDNDSRPTADNSPVFPDDFTEPIENEPFSHLGGKTVRAIGGWMTKYVGHYLPTTCTEYFYMNMLGVHPHFRGCKIGYTLWMESLKLGHRLGYKYSQTICTALASNKLAKVSGMDRKLTVFYGDVKYKGKALFKDGTVNDGGREMIMWIGDLDKIFSTTI